MSNPESFIEEVTQEVRRERLFALFRKYGWIGALLVVLIVAGASYREWTSTQKKKAAEALGDSILASLDIDDVPDRAESLLSLDISSAEGAALVSMLVADALLDAGRIDEAVLQLESIAKQDALPKAYRDLAAFKSLLMQGPTMEPDDMIAWLEPLTAPGRPFRVLALEQTAIALVRLNRMDEATEMLQQLFNDTEAPIALRTRIFQLANASGIKIDFSRTVSQQNIIDPRTRIVSEN